MLKSAQLYKDRRDSCMTLLSLKYWQKNLRGDHMRTKNKLKCENCEYMECSDVIYKSYYCTAHEECVVHLGVDYPPKRPPKSCPKRED